MLGYFDLQELLRRRLSRWTTSYSLRRITDSIGIAAGLQRQQLTEAR